MPFKGKRDKKGIRLSPPPELSLPISNLRGQIEEGQLRRDKRGGAHVTVFILLYLIFFFLFFASSCHFFAVLENVNMLKRFQIETFNK